MLKEGTFNTDGVTINFAEGPPSGPPLVLLHGGGDRWQNFLPIIPSLMMRWHIYALDLRGHGKSGRVPGQYRPEHYVGDIVAFLESQLAERVILFGHSLGGWIVLMVAAELMDKVQALVLGDPPLCIERFLAIEGSKEMRYGDLPGTDAAHLRGWAKTLSQVDPDVVQYHADGRLDEYVRKVDLDSPLQRVTCPALLLQGDPSQGGVVSDIDVEYALSLLPDGLHVQLEGTGHDLGLDAWRVAPLLRALMNFLESL
jgi:pimeloyl-ACP methyl ester carboxylesterase